MSNQPDLLPPQVTPSGEPEHPQSPSPKYKPRWFVAVGASLGTSFLFWRLTHLITGLIAMVACLVIGAIFLIWKSRSPHPDEPGDNENLPIPRRNIMSVSIAKWSIYPIESAIAGLEMRSWAIAGILACGGLGIVTLRYTLWASIKNLGYRFKAWRLSKTGEVSRRIEPLDPTIRLFPAHIPDTDSFRDGGILYLVAHWKKALPFKSWTSRVILSLATLGWCFLLLPFITILPLNERQIGLARLITMIGLTAFIYGKVWFYQFRARLNYTEMTLLEVKIHQGWWIHTIETFQWDKVVVNTTDSGNPIVTYLGLDVGDIEFTLGIGDDQPHVIEGVAGARRIRQALNDKTSNQALGDLEALIAQRELIIALHKALPTIVSSLEALPTVVENLNTVIELGQSQNRQLGQMLTYINSLGGDVRQVGRHIQDGNQLAMFKAAVADGVTAEHADAFFGTNRGPDGQNRTVAEHYRLPRSNPITVDADVTTAADEPSAPTAE